MIKSEKKLINLASLLQKEDATLIAQAVEMLREEEPFEGAIGLLASTYDGNHGPLVDRAIEAFINDLKDHSLCPEVIAEIQKDWKPHTLSMLVSSCWQSGMDYMGYSRDLAEVFLRSEYIVAVECFTVIEESAPSLTKHDRDEIVGMLKQSALSGAGSKKELIRELILVLER